MSLILFVIVGVLFACYSINHKSVKESLFLADYDKVKYCRCKREFDII